VELPVGAFFIQRVSVDHAADTGSCAFPDLFLESGEVKSRDNAMGIESVDRVSRVTLCREGRVRLNSNRLR
jgi:hypothetical protein